jgi:N-acetylmuramoyl-L-alanine amidase/FG-GAP-like repeat
VVAFASVLALVPMVTGLPHIAAPAQPHSVTSQIRQVAFVNTSVAAMQAAKSATSSASSGLRDPLTTARAGAVAPVQDVAGAVTVVGVTWPKGSKSARSQFQIRTLTGAAWSRWESFDVDPADNPDPTEAAAATGTSPYVVTGASKYEVRALTTDPAAPIAAKVQVVDPGTSSADNIQQAPGAASAAAAKPAIYTRAQWGANESLRRGAPSYGKVMVGFVHHTDNANSYTAAEVPAMIRGMYAYHVQSLGWADIGYNFLVDRFGRTWEGRYGGMDKAVVGAQTLNFNSVSMGVSAIGNFEVATAPQVMTDAIKRVLAWKFTLAGIPATGTVLVNGKYLQRVSGHRDAFATACPGQYLYAKLPEIRTGASAMMSAKPPTPVPTLVPTPVPAPVAASRGAFSPGDFTGDRKADILAITRSGDLHLYRGSGLGGFTGGGTKIGSGWGVFTKVFSGGDFTGDAKADILAVKANGDLVLYRGNGLGGFTGAGTKIGSGWGVFTKVFSPGDFTGDRKADILAVKANGDLVLYRGNGLGGFTGAGTRIGAGWGVFTKVFSPGDFTGDRKADILAIKANGDLVLYRGNGLGGFTGAGIKIGSGWGVFANVFSGGDFTGDTRSDILAIKANGDLVLYRGNGLGGFTGAGTRIGTGWGAFL